MANFNTYKLKPNAGTDTVVISKDNTLLLSIYVCNTDAADVTVSVDIDGHYLLKDVTITKGVTLTALRGRVFAAIGETITTSCSGTADVTITALEQASDLL